MMTEKHRYSSCGKTKLVNSLKNALAYLIATLITTLLLTIVYWPLFALICIGFDSYAVSRWLPLILAAVASIVTNVILILKYLSESSTTYSINFKKQIYRGTANPKKYRCSPQKYYRYTSGSDDDPPSWSPGCPEDGLFSSMDSAFDFNGDGHLDSIESSTKFDVFFGDDDE